jgi:hypothetical protein
MNVTARMGRAYLLSAAPASADIPRFGRPAWGYLAGVGNGWAVGGFGGCHHSFGGDWRGNDFGELRRYDWPLTDRISYESIGSRERIGDDVLNTRKVFDSEIIIHKVRCPSRLPIIADSLPVQGDQGFMIGENGHRSPS